MDDKRLSHTALLFGVQSDVTNWIAISDHQG